MREEKRTGFRFQAAGYGDVFVGAVRALQFILILILISGAVGAVFEPAGALFEIYMESLLVIRSAIMGALFPPLEFSDHFLILYFLVPILLFIKFYVLDYLLIDQE